MARPQLGQLGNSWLSIFVFLCEGYDLPEDVLIKNYLKSTLRSIKRHKGYAFINIAGLAIGMACCILILMYITTELRYDRYHENADRIFRLGLDANMGGTTVVTPISNVPSAPTLIQGYPEVLNAVRIRTVSKRAMQYEDKIFFENSILYVDSAVFQVFTFPMIKGDPTTALKPAYSIVLTEETARRYFGNKNPMGKILKYNNQYDFTVTGVIENVPHNSHFTFDMLCSYETLYDLDRKAMEEWFNFRDYTYLLLSEGIDYKELEQKFPALIDKYMGDMLKALGGEIDFFLQPLKSIHLHSNMENEIRPNSSITYIYIFAAIGLFILCIACINFMNLATARSSTRAKEVGMRKVVGAKRKELIWQFLGERLSDIFSSFSVFAIFIACLGLFGMASFAAEQRTKEIGIRKVLGASVTGVVVLLSKDFLKLIVAANIIAWPLAYFGMNKWMQNFAYKSGIDLWVFLYTVILAVGIALITVSYQSIKAALLNPVDAIKYE